MNDDIANQVAQLSAKGLSELLEQTDTAILNSLRDSVYPGAKDRSIAMVLAYCRAKNYDPLAKACYIVPMSVKNPISGQNEWRDVIMPGIASYRIDAVRTGCYSGKSDPIFGDLITENLDGVSITYPEWCKVIVKRQLKSGGFVEFSAIEYWKENYATKGKDSVAPNNMWKKRPRAQLAKCAEAQALRQAFPDVIGSNVTFDEMEGKTEKETVGERVDLPQLPPQSTITSEQAEQLRQKLKEAEIDETRLCLHYAIDCLEAMTMPMFEKNLNIAQKRIASKKPQEAEANTVDDFFKGVE